jgi:hypothetical protein
MRINDRQPNALPSPGGHELALDALDIETLRFKGHPILGRMPAALDLG